MSVSEDLTRLHASHSIFDVSDPLPVQYTISVNVTEAAIANVKINKATGPDKIPPWFVRDFAQQLAGPVTSIFNSSLREGMLPKFWKTATVIPLPNKRPPESIENDIRPIALTPILAKVFDSIVLKWVDNIIIPQIDDKQFGGMAVIGTTDALVEMLHKWYEANDEPGIIVRVLLLDYSKAFDLINHETLINKLVAMNLPADIVRWMAAFHLDREQTVKIGESVSQPGYSNRGVPQGTLSGPMNLLVYINDLRTPCSIYKYVDDSTVFEISNPTSVSVLQQSAAIIANWYIDNGMRINTMKTKEMIIMFCRDPVFLPYIINIDGAA